MMMNHFSLIGKVFGNPRIKEYVVDGEKRKELIFYLCDVDSGGNIYELHTMPSLFERGSMFFRNGNVVKVDGLIRTNYIPRYKKPRKVNSRLLVTQFIMLVKANSETKEYTSVLKLYPQIANTNGEGDDEWQ